MVRFSMIQSQTSFESRFFQRRKINASFSKVLANLPSTLNSYPFKVYGVSDKYLFCFYTR